MTATLPRYFALTLTIDHLRKTCVCAETLRTVGPRLNEIRPLTRLDAALQLQLLRERNTQRP